MISRPCAFRSATSPVRATVGEGLTRSSVAERKGMVVTRQAKRYILIEVEDIARNPIGHEMDDFADDDWYSDDAATFGDRLAAAREAKGMNQKAFARRLGVAPETVEGWENDMREPRANKLQMMSGILDVSMSWLLTGEGRGVDPEVDAGHP